MKGYNNNKGKREKNGKNSSIDMTMLVYFRNFSSVSRNDLKSLDKL
jgi:hypothetical protein